MLRNTVPVPWGKVSNDFEEYNPEFFGMPYDDLIKYSTRRLWDDPIQAKLILRAAGPENCACYLVGGLKDPTRVKPIFDLLFEWIFDKNVIGNVIGALGDEKCREHLEELLIMHYPVSEFTIDYLIKALGNPVKSEVVERILFIYASDDKYGARDKVKKYLRHIPYGNSMKNFDKDLFKEKASSLLSRLK